MNLETIKSEILKLDLPERLAVMHSLIDSIADEKPEYDYSLSDEDVKEILRRRDDAITNPTTMKDIRIVEERIIKENGF